MIIGIFVYYFIIILASFIFLRLLFGNIISPLISLGLSFGLGCGINAIIFVTLSLLGIKVTSMVMFFILIFLFLASVIPYYYYGDKNLKEYLFKMYKAVKTKHNLKKIVVTLLIFAIGLLLFTNLYTALSRGYNHDDEWSYWGTATNRIYQTNSINISKMGLDGFEIYPLLVPITAASSVIFVGNFAENFTKLVSPISLIFLTIILGAYLSNRRLKSSENLLFLLIFLLSGNLLGIFSSILYGDIFFSYLYTSAVIMFSLFLEEGSSKKILLMSGLFFALSSWTKVDGFILCFGSMLYLSLLYLIYFKKTSVKDKLTSYLILLLPSIVTEILWVTYSKIHNFAQAGWTDKLFVNTGYAFSNLLTILRKMLGSVINQYNYSGIWLFIILGLILGIFICIKNKEYLLCSGIIVVNIIFHLATYLFVFKKQELIIAASFERYALHFLGTAIIMLSVVYQELVRRLNSAEK